MRHVPPFTKVSFERTNIKVSSIKKQDRVMSRKNEKVSKQAPDGQRCFLA